MDDMSDNAYDCILDIGAKLIPSIENQLTIVSEHQLLLELQLDMKNIIGKLHFSLTQQADQAEKIVDSVAGHISESLDKLELTEVQESFFLNLIESQLQVEFRGTDFKTLENAATQIYEKITSLQNKPEKQNLQSSQFGEIDLF
ncbi:MAG: glycerate kinase [Glaciecola sp.]|jgi:glycerate kinase